MKKPNIWVEFAVEDLKMAKLAMKEKIYNQVCFHSQQAVEKIFKGYLETKNVLPPKTHKLTDLISLINNGIIKKFKNEIILLDRFYIPTRYPDALPGSLPIGLPKEKDAKDSLETAIKIVKELRDKIKE